MKKVLKKIEPFMIIVIIASFTGVVGGVFGALFIKTLDIFIDFRNT